MPTRAGRPVASAIHRTATLTGLPIRAKDVLRVKGARRSCSSQPSWAAEPKLLTCAFTRDILLMCTPSCP